MKYDDASWHSDGDFPAELPPEAGATQYRYVRGMAPTAGYGRRRTGRRHAGGAEILDSACYDTRQFLLVCDGKFLDEMINDEANAFTLEYYQADDCLYPDDYIELLADDLPSLYHVADTWENFDRLAPVIAQRFAAWQATQT